MVSGPLLVFSNFSIIRITLKLGKVKVNVLIYEMYVKCEIVNTGQ